MLLLCMCGIVLAQGVGQSVLQSSSVTSRRAFVHPGGVHTLEDLERIKEKVLMGESPWIDGWNLMIQDPKAQYTYKAAPAESVAGPSGRRQRAARDGVAAYYNILRWYVTGDERHAQCAVDILNDWSAAVNDVITGELFQLPANIFVEVAEVVRVYPGWKEEDIERFKRMCKDYFYPACRDFLGECGSWSGWDGPANTCNMAIGIFCDDERIYNEAVEYYKSGAGGGCLTQMVNPVTFQVNEMGRDIPHAEIGPGSAAELCQMAWSQGDDLFGLEDNLLLKGFEYLCRFNLEHTYDRWEWDTEADCAGRYFYYPATCWRRSSGRSFVISNMPANEIIYNHYVVRKGLEAPYTAAMINTRGLTSCSWEAPGYVAFTYTLDADKSPFLTHELPAAPVLNATAGLREVVLSWTPHEGDVVNGAVIERALSADGPFEEVGRWEFNTTPFYADTTVTGGTTYFYRVAMVNKAGVGTRSEVVEATPHSGRPLPDEWQLTNFGNEACGNAWYDAVNGHTFAIRGTGTSFGAREDNVTYVYTPVRGNSTLVVRFFDSVNSDDRSERAGIMMREGLGGDARMASVGLADAGFRYVWFAPRTAVGQSASWIPGNTHTWLEVWFKLTREGDLFTAYQSLDGQTWFKIGEQTVAMSDDYYAGIYAASSTAIQVFADHVTVEDECHRPLPAVEGLQADAVNSSRVVLSWTPLEEADYYVVGRSFSPDGPFEIVDAYCLDTSYADTGLAPETECYYEVYAVGMAGMGETSRIAATTPALSLPASPQSLTVWPGGSRAFLRWKGVDEAVSYAVYRSQLPDGGFELLADVTETDYADNGLNIGTTYYYKVVARNALGESDGSEVAAYEAGGAEELRLLPSATVIGTPGSWDGAGNTCDKAMDGNVGTYFDSDVETGAYVGLDLGRNCRAVLSSVGYAPRNSYAHRLYDGCFQLSDDADFAHPVTVWRIDTYDADYGLVTHQEVDVRRPYRYLRYLSAGQGSWGNIAEAVFWGYPVELQNQTIDFAPLPGVSLDMGSLELQATASSGLPVEFTSSDPSIAYVSGNRVYLLAAGTCEIYADQPGDAVYGTAERVSQALVVDPTAVRDVRAASAHWSFSYGPGPDCLTLRSEGEPRPFRYEVFSSQGMHVTGGASGGDGPLVVSMSGWPCGVYLLRLSDGVRVDTHKLVRR